MLSVYDYIVIAAFFALMFYIGLVFKRLNKTTSDYFRSGGSMLWHVVGATTFMSFISAVTYTGAAGKAYETGTVVLVVYFANGFAFLVSAAYFAAKYRQSRVVTAIEIVRERFGRANEQLFTWMLLPFGFIHGGVLLYSLAIIIATVFGMNITFTIVTVGLVVLIMSFLGGSWAIMISDFMQLVIMVPVSVAMAALSLYHLGGVSNFLTQLPTSQYNWSELADPKIVWLWVVATVVKQMFTVNNISDGYRFLAAKDSKNASKGALMTAILFFTLAIIWFIPPMAATIFYPDITQVEVLKPLGAKASEGIYLAMCVKFLPAGMIGLMISAIYSATMSALDGVLNRNVGVFVRNFYQPILRPDAEDKELMYVSRFATAVLGSLVVVAALFFSELKTLNLFDLNLRVSAMISLPFMVPLLLGMLVRRTPRWAGWTTVLIGMTISWVISNYGNAQAIADRLGVLKTLGLRETTDVMFTTNVLAVIVVCSAWFLASRFFASTSPPAYHEGVDALFERLEKPVDYLSEHGATETDGIQYKMLGMMCLVFGSVITLLILTPNELAGRLSIAFVGLSMMTVGFIFTRLYRQTASKLNENS